MQRSVKEHYKISPFLVLFLVHSVQTGIKILTFQQDVVPISGNDSWIVILFTALFVHAVTWMIYRILDRGHGDLIAVHHDMFGKWFGGLLSIVWIFYFALIGFVVLRSFIEVIQVWMFPEISSFWLSLVILLLVYYCVAGGFRVVAGICFLGVIIPSYLLFTLFFMLGYMDFHNLLPVWNHKPAEMLQAATTMLGGYIGFTVIFMFYPYIQNAKSSQKWAHGGIAASTFVYLILMITAIAFFGVNRMEHTVWPTLEMWKIVTMPFVERFEYIGISTWTLIVLTNLCPSFWAASRGIRQLFSLNQRHALIGILIISLILSSYINGKEQIDALSSMLDQMGLYLNSLYVPLLFILSLFLLRRKKS